MPISKKKSSNTTKTKTVAKTATKKVVAKKVSKPTTKVVKAKVAKTPKFNPNAKPENNKATRVNKDTGYRCVNKITRENGKVVYRARVMFQGDEYGTGYPTAIEAAQAVNKLANKLYGKREAKRRGFINTIPAEPKQ